MEQVKEFKRQTLAYAYAVEVDRLAEITSKLENCRRYTKRQPFDLILRYTMEYGKCNERCIELFDKLSAV